jgi:hypothetical protein
MSAPDRERKSRTSASSQFEYELILCCNYIEPKDIVSRAQLLFKDASAVNLRVYSTNVNHKMLSQPGITFNLVENEWNDFTGYKIACQQIVQEERESDGGKVYVFLNDTLFSKHPAKLLLHLIRKAASTIRSATLPILVGRADSYSTLLQTSPFAPGLDQYISTFLFATNREGVETLQQLFGSAKTIPMMLNASSPNPEVLPEKFHAFIRMHLNSEGSHFSWNGNRDGDALKRKAGGVVLEHLISAEFYNRGFIFPVNYNVAIEFVLWMAYWLRRKTIYRRCN